MVSQTQKRLANIIERYAPKILVNSARDALLYASIDMQPGIWLLFSFANSFLIGIIAALILRDFTKVYNFAIMTATISMFTVVLMAILHNVLLYYGGKKAIQIERMLPDALQLIAANIRADIPIHKAIILSARPEFGLLAVELGKLGDEILSGKPTDQAFRDMSHRIKSPLMTRITTLMEEGLRSGHDLAGMLEQVAYDIRAFKILEEEANANIGGYAVFIMMAVLIIAPILYTISISFIDLSDQVKTTLNIGALVADMGGAGSQSTLVNLVAGDRGISADTLKMFAAMNLAASAGIAAILVSVLQTGESLQKLPYIPAFIFIAEFIYLIASLILSTVFGGLFAG